MKISYCTKRNILHTSTLLDFKYEIGPYYGCEHNCHYCYAHDQEETDWTREILIHEDFTEQLETELSGLEPQTIFIGMDTDPYQPVEEKYRHTRETLKLFSNKGFGACILTRSDLVVRDIDLLVKMPGSSVGISVAFQDEKTRTLFEASSPSTERRVEALRKVKQAGIETYAMITPVMPLITDIDFQLDMLADCADTIWIYRLSMKSEDVASWKNTENILREHFPELADRFKEITFSSGHQYWTDLKRKLEDIQKKRQLNLVINI